MGHRANFVIIRDAAAEAFFDQWAGLGCAFAVADGVESAEAAARQSDPTDELLDWAFAEGGYLIDHDEHALIVFGELDDLSVEFEEFSAEFEGEDESVAYDESDEDSADEDDAEDEDEGESSAVRFRKLFDEIAPHWHGWLLRWDERGVDAFAEHLQRRGIEDIRTQEPSHPDDPGQYELQA